MSDDARSVPEKFLGKPTAEMLEETARERISTPAEAINNIRAVGAYIIRHGVGTPLMYGIELLQSAKVFEDVMRSSAPAAADDTAPARPAASASREGEPIIETISDLQKLSHG